MAMLYDSASTDYLFGLDIINYIFTGIFHCGNDIKDHKLFKEYWYDSWNVFDFLYCNLQLCRYYCFLFYFNFFNLFRIGPQLIRVLRILRVSRLLRLVKKYKRFKI